MFKKKLSPLNIVLIAVVAVLALAIITTFTLFGIFKGNEAPTVFGSRIFIMDDSRMGDKVKEGSAVFVEEGLMPTDPGNAILCKVEGELSVVRYMGVQPSTDIATGEVSTKYIVKYDNDTQLFIIEETDIIGRAVSYSTFLGGIIRFASSTLGMLLVVILPCAAIVIYEVVMLVLGLKKKNVGAKSVPAPTRTYPTHENGYAPTMSANSDYNAWIAANTVQESEPEEEYEEYDAIEPIGEYRDPVYEEQAEASAPFNYYWQTEAEPKAPEAPVYQDPAPYEAPVYEAPVYEEPASQPYAPTVQEPRFEDIEVKADPKPADDVLNSISSMRIDELMKMLEEEKKKLGE